MKRIAQFLAALAVLLSFGPAFAGVPPIPPPAPVRATRAPYTGYVANNTGVPNGVNLAQQWVRSDEAHIAKADMLNWKACYSNWYVAAAVAPTNGTEANVGTSTATQFGWVEYPSTVFTALTWSGSTTGSLPAGSTVCTDTIPVAIPEGATFRIRQLFQNADGVPYNTIANDAGNRATSGTGTGVLTTATVISLSSGVAFPPVMILGTTTKDSIALEGDSHVKGQSDVQNASLGMGVFDRNITIRGIGTANLGVPADRIAWAAANYTKRCVIAAYATKIYSDYGVNDVFGGGAGATVLANLQTLYGLSCNLGKPIAQATLMPINVTSTDGYITEANQTVNAGVVTNNTIVNTGIRNGTTGVSYVIDLAAQVESTTTPGKWTVLPYGIARTTDGAHNKPISQNDITSASRVLP